MVQAEFNNLGMTLKPEVEQIIILLACVHTDLRGQVSAKLHQAMQNTVAARFEQSVNCVTNFFRYWATDCIVIVLTASVANSCLEPDVEDEPDSFSAPFKVERLDDYLNSEKDEIFFTTAQRSDLTYAILNHISYGKKASHKGLAKLVANGSFVGAYPLHDGLYGVRQVHACMEGCAWISVPILVL
jgi:hypothetical protein